MSSGVNFTVVVPTHRRPVLLAEALRSVASQTLAPAQVLVVDDAGDEATRAVVSEFPGFEYVVNTRGAGGSGARNEGAFRATGEWIAYLDDDDVWLPRKLESVAGVIAEGGEELVMVYSGSENFVSDTGEVVAVKRPTARGHVLEDVLYQNVVGGMSVVVARRDVLVGMGGMDERFPAMQDMELFVALASRGTFDFVPEPLVRVRVGTGRRITSDGSKKVQAAVLFAEKYASLLATRPRHRHRAAARVFVHSLRARDVEQALRYLPWTAAGLIVDPANVPYVVKGIFRYLVPQGRAAAVPASAR